MCHWPALELLDTSFLVPVLELWSAKAYRQHRRRKSLHSTQALSLVTGEGLTKNKQWPRKIKNNLKTIVMLTSRIFLRLELSRPKSFFTYPWAPVDCLFKNPKEMWEGKQTTHCGWAACDLTTGRGVLAGPFMCSEIRIMKPSRLPSLHADRP